MAIELKTPDLIRRFRLTFTVDVTRNPDTTLNPDYRGVYEIRAVDDNGDPVRTESDRGNVGPYLTTQERLALLDMVKRLYNLAGTAYGTDVLP